MYRARSSWFILEALLGYIALSAGISGISKNNGGQLFWALYGLGENLSWGVSFMGLGGILLCAALVDRVSRALHREAHYRLFATIRKMMHLGLVVCWSFAVIVFSYDSIPIPAIVLLAPALVVVHIRGAWEHAKVSRCLYMPQHRTVYGAILDRVKRICRTGHKDSRRKGDPL